MAKKPLPTPDELRQLLRYDPDTGKLFWKERGSKWFSEEWRQRSWNTRYAGKEAFCTVYGPKGYLQGCIRAEMYMAHRVIYCMHFGDPGLLEIDHLDGNRTNNILDNLRAVSSLENSRNNGIRKDNKTGAIGVYYNSIGNFWHARIKVAGVNRYIGRFPDFSSAAAARRDAERKYGYHENHGMRLGR